MNNYSLIISFLIYAFYFLNIYWSLIILKKIVKLVKHHITKKHCETILQYTYFASLIYSIYAYIFTIHFKLIFILDICGILYLTYSSYLFHYTLKSNLLINRLDDKMIYIYLNDIIAINIRPLFCMIVMCPRVAHILFIIHFICIVIYINYLLDLKTKKVEYPFDTLLTLPYSYKQHLVHILILIDCIIPIFYQPNPIAIIIPGLFILVFTVPIACEKANAAILTSSSLS